MALDILLDIDNCANKANEKNTYLSDYLTPEMPTPFND